MIENSNLTPMEMERVGLKLCHCGSTRMFQNYANGHSGTIHWFIKCNCGKYTEWPTMKEAVDLWNFNLENK